MIIIWDQETEPNIQFKYTAISAALVTLKGYCIITTTSSNQRLEKCLPFTGVCVFFGLTIYCTTDMAITSYF